MKDYFRNFSVLLFVLLISSCADSDDSVKQETPDVVQSKIIGSWIIKGMTVNGEYEVWAKEAGDVVLEFKTGGVLIVTSEEETVTSTYKISGDKLTVSSSDGVDVFTITELTDTKLALFFREDVDDDEGIDDATYHLERI